MSTSSSLVDRDLRYRRLAKRDLDEIHRVSLEILEDVGVHILDREARSILKKGGANVDGSRVRLPHKRTEWALDVVPKALMLFDQTGEESLLLEGRSSYFGNGSDLLYTIDLNTNERREARLSDVENIVRTLDFFDNFDFIMSGFLPRDVPADEAELLQMKVMLQYTNKPLVYVTTNSSITKTIVEMAEIVAGSESYLRERPFATCYINITNPLRHNPESIRKLIWLSQKGLPFVYRPALVTRGVTTPITGAGFLAVQNAASLAGLVLSQLVNEGAPFIRDSCSGGTFDMRYMVGQHSAPEIRGFNEDLLHYYGLPGFGIGGTTGSKTVDQQASLEAALTLITSAQAGAQLIHDVGYMDNGTTGSLEQLVICNEIIGWIKAYLRPIKLDENTFALEEIRKVSDEESDFLGSDNTVRFFREDYYPHLLDRQNYDSWMDGGGRSLRERVADTVNDILSRPVKSYLQHDQIEALDRVIG